MWTFYADMPSYAHSTSDVTIMTACLAVSVIAWGLFLSLTSKAKNENR